MYGMNSTANPQIIRCTECGRPLRSAASIALGRGPVCDLKARRRRAAAALARNFKNPKAAAAKALSHIEDQALVNVRHAGQYLAVSSDGEQTYLVDVILRFCTCKAHENHGRCTHLLAAQIAEATAARGRDYTLAA